ncbi:MAG TPA: endonuclease/exonuclease/phosphatase family protein [Myxococcota bacterium]|nr:endonuclease/exonuclease/phosphatase family protein [Myxococcota bacterium]
MASIPETRSALPEVSLARRREILALEPSPARHGELLEALGFASALEVVRSRGAVRLREEPLRVVAWNAQRCRDPARAAELLRATGGDVFLLSELDVGMARSGQVNAPRELAGRLGCSAAFAVEFLELGLGDAQERQAHAGLENAVGFHGGAILARGELVAPEVVRLERSGRWFDGRLGERRVGSRIAVLCRLALGGRELALASLHLESHSDPGERAAQLDAVFDALERLAPGAPALVGGDVNTHSLGLAELEDRERRRVALARDPGRLSDPIAHEPLFALAERRGFQWRAANLRPAATYKRDGRGALQLDWFFARGLHVSEPAVIPSDDLSDHEAIAVSVRLA